MICGQCGKKFNFFHVCNDTNDKNENEVSSSSINKIIYCQECGNKQQNDAKFCHDCGKMLLIEHKNSNSVINTASVDSKNKNFEYDVRSGKKEASIIPDEIRGWNWGAFFLEPIWGMAHSLWISLLAFIPLVNIVVIIYLGIKGNELAWRNNKWKGVNDFKRTQKKWAMWGIGIFIISILIGISGL